MNVFVVEIMLCWRHLISLRLVPLLSLHLLIISDLLKTIFDSPRKLFSCFHRLWFFPCFIIVLRVDYFAFEDIIDLTYSLRIMSYCCLQIPSPVCNAYIRRYILSRMFTVIDTKKDGILDFEEYTCAVALFRTGNTEDKLRCKVA